MGKQMNANNQIPRQNSQIALIGPTCAGKSTVSALLGVQLNRPVVSLDEIGETYYIKVGFDKETTERIIDEEGFRTFLVKWQPALAYATIQVLQDYPDHIIDLGAGHTHYEDESQFDKVQSALLHCSEVILLLPSPNLALSVELLRARNIAEREWDWIVDGYDYIEHWVQDPHNHQLATMTIYTAGQTPEQTCLEIATKLTSRQA